GPWLDRRAGVAAPPDPRRACFLRRPGGLDRVDHAADRLPHSADAGGAAQRVSQAPRHAGRRDRARAGPLRLRPAPDRERPVAVRLLVARRPAGPGEEPAVLGRAAAHGHAPHPDHPRAAHPRRAPPRSRPPPEPLTRAAEYEAGRLSVVEVPYGETKRWEEQHGPEL